MKRVRGSASEGLQYKLDLVQRVHHHVIKRWASRRDHNVVFVWDGTKTTEPTLGMYSQYPEEKANGGLTYMESADATGCA